MNKCGNFWRARSRLYQNEILQENMRLTAFFKLYKIGILLYRCNLKILTKNRFEKSANFVKIKIQRNWQMSEYFWKFAKFQKIQLDNFVEFQKCSKTRICLQRSATIQQKTSEILPKIWPKIGNYFTGPLRRGRRPGEVLGRREPLAARHPQRRRRRPGRKAAPRASEGSN